MSESLTQVLADARGELQLLRRSAPTVTLDYLEQLVDRITAAAAPFTKWISEPDAHLQSGLSYRTLRRRHRELMDAGLARYNVRREREYLEAVVPRRVDVAAVKAEARSVA